MRILTPETVNKNNKRTLTQLFTADIKQVNTYSVTRGAILGNHYHKETYEYFYITKGSFLMQSKDKQGVLIEKVIGPGSLFVIEPYTVHTIESLSKDGQFMTFLTKEFKQESPDIYV